MEKKYETIEHILFAQHSICIRRVLVNTARYKRSTSQRRSQLHQIFRLAGGEGPINLGGF